MSLLSVVLLGVFLWLFVVGVAYILFTGVWQWESDMYLATFIFGDYRHVYVPAEYAEKHGLNKDARLGILGFNIAVLVPPFASGVYFPTTDIQLRYRPTEVYDKDMLPLVLRVTITIRLDARLDLFIRRINVLGLGKNLAEKRPTTYRSSYDPVTGEEKRVSYDTDQPCITRAILDATEDVVWENVRKVACQSKFTNIAGRLADFERLLGLELAEEESVFAQAGILVRSKTNFNRAFNGPSVLSRNGVDIIVTQVLTDNPEYLKALALPGIRRNEGKAEGLRVAEISRRTGVSADQVLGYEALKQAETFNIFAAGDGVVDILAPLARMARGQRTTGKQDNPPKKTP
ncbi:MAG: hypothetical protein WD200_01775 [Candidatus Andersenbacteria bacterium]